MNFRNIVFRPVITVTGNIALTRMKQVTTADGFKQASSNQFGKQYLQGSSEGRVRVRISNSNFNTYE
jgi:hypothetical protein